MPLRRILAAADESAEGRAAIFAAAALGRETSAEVSVLGVTSPPREPPDGAGALTALRQLVGTTLSLLADPPMVEIAVTVGVPGIEIARHAESMHADLLVVGRKRRPPGEPPAVGATVEFVAGRSVIPCLFVLPDAQRFTRVLVALDGTDRGMAVLPPALDFIRATGARLRAISVQPRAEDGARRPLELTARSSNLLALVNARRAGVELGAGRWEVASREVGTGPLIVRHGSTIAEILDEIQTYAADVLVLGYHRGGTGSGSVGSSVAPRLLLEAPCAVLTVPL